MTEINDLPDIGLCALANLRQVMRSVSQAYDAALKPCGLRATQFTLLAVQAKRGPMPLTGLADIVVDRTTLTRNLRPLTRDGLVVSTPQEDQRVRELASTDKGTLGACRRRASLEIDTGGFMKGHAILGPDHAKALGRQSTDL